MCNLKQNCFAIDDCGLDVCGVYSSCNDNDNPICKCLPGFQPISEKEWDSGKWDAGCLPSTPSGCRNDDGFVQLKRMRVRNNPIFTSANSSDECKAYCLRDCACVACTYGLNSRSDCAVFYGELKGVQELEEGEGLHQKNSPISTPVDLHVRVAAASLENITGGKRCSNCGANIIPYPLSTGPNCGDPAYRGFSCNDTVGQLRFRALDGASYAVTSINAEKLTFVIQPERICWPNEAKSRDLQLNSTQPFQITRKNTILLLSCSDSPSLSSLRCTSAEVCKRYMSGDDALCFASRSCCSYTAGRLPLTSHSISISGPNCSAYTSFVNANLSQLKDQWVEGVEISWKASLEPVCDSSADCRSWPNSRCSTTPSGQKRCICNANFQWDPFQLMCTGGDH
ncbi:wall-associated receptor kinase-like 20 [Aristolochia californica]|uniref:wall-associated receptor kinase-like 20 n=1 Tax=Aristolochia californica TaxID=171875 RepID=UPI0035E2D79C